MNIDEYYINQLFNQRVLLKTHNQQLLHKIYASKYANWVVPFLQSKKVKEVPLLICCHTLKKLPYFYSLNGKSFFIIDFSLYDYFYDLNYSFSSEERNEFFTNVCIKAIIEQLYISHNIDLCYLLCTTSNNIEKYKLENDYKNDKLMYDLAEKTDLQEAFLLLHEAMHAFFDKTDDVSKHPSYNTIKYIFKSDKLPPLDELFWEECLCDYEAISYIFQKEFESKSVSVKAFVVLFFEAIRYLYYLQYISETFFGTNQTVSNEQFSPLVIFSLRLNVVYYSICNYFIENKYQEYLDIIKPIYEENVLELKTDAKTLRIIMNYINEELPKITDTENLNISKNEKTEYIKDFLLLL